MANPRAIRSSLSWVGNQDDRFKKGLERAKKQRRALDHLEGDASLIQRAQDISDHLIAAYQDYFHDGCSEESEDRIGALENALWLITSKINDV